MKIKHIKIHICVFYDAFRDGKEVACDITALPRGTVVFEDVGAEYFTGQVLKPLDRHLKHLSASNAVPGSNGQEGEALSGRIKYRGEDRSEVEVLFGEKDQVQIFTTFCSDWFIRYGWNLLSCIYRFE